MKTITRLTVLISFALVIHACGINEFSRQKYTNFGHAKSLHLKPSKHANSKDQSTSYTEADEVKLRSILRTSSDVKAMDSIPTTRTATISVTQHSDFFQCKRPTLNSVAMVSNRMMQKTRKEQSEKRTDHTIHNWSVISAFLALILAGFALTQTTRKETDDEDVLRFRKIMKLALLITLGLGIFSGLLFITGVLLTEWFAYMGMLMGGLAILALVYTFVLFLCYKVRTKGARIWALKPVTEERLTELDKKAKVFSMIAYLTLILFAGFLIAVSLNLDGLVMMFIPLSLLGIAVTFLIAAVVNGRKYKKGCESMGIERSKKSLNRHRWNCFLMWFFGVIAVLGGGFIGLLFAVL